ncbi:MAG: TerB family tellurite resistance protein [Hyphomicrobiales bacterium]
MSMETLPVVAGAIILLAILVPTIALWITYQKYKRVAAALPDAGALAAAGSSQIDERQAALKARLLQDWARIPEAEVELARHALWTAMLLEAASDGSVDHREMQFVADLFGRMSGTQVDFRPVIKAAEQAHGAKKAALAEIGKAKGLSNLAKQQVLAGAFLVSVCDHALTDHELDCLVKIADALHVGGRERKRMLEDIAARFEAPPQQVRESA